VDHAPPPTDALGTIHKFISALGEQGATIELMHVGVTEPPIRRISDGALMWVTKRTGDVVGTILNAAADLQADLIAMPTAGHHGFLDAIRGSTTERVLRHAPCPVLAVPAG
jgi:nucleotide-binding universal stress UspA family protein